MTDAIQTNLAGTAGLPDIGEEDYAALKADIAERGIERAIIVDAQTGQVIAGQNRLAIAMELRIPKARIPIQKQSFADDTARMLAMLADNFRHSTSENRMRHKRSIAQSMYARMNGRKNAVKQIARVLRVTESSIHKYTEDMRAKEQERVAQEIVRAKDEGKSQREIASALKVPKTKVQETLRRAAKAMRSEIGTVPKTGQPAARRPVSLARIPKPNGTTVPRAKFVVMPPKVETIEIFIGNGIDMQTLEKFFKNAVVPSFKRYKQRAAGCSEVAANPGMTVLYDPTLEKGGAIQVLESPKEGKAKQTITL